MAIKDEFQITRQGKQFVLFAGLLDEAHSQGLESIEVEEIHVAYDQDGKALRARHKATVKLDGKTFVGHGDADVGNVARNIAPHLIRMSETRAKARALRDAINVGTAALEELGGDEEPSETQGQRPTPAPPKGPVRKAPNQKRKPAPADREENPPQEESPDEDPERNSEPFASTEQIQALEKLLEAMAEEGETKEDAVERMETWLEYPLALLAQSKADELIATLQEKRNKKALQEAKS